MNRCCQSIYVNIDQVKRYINDPITPMNHIDPLVSHYIIIHKSICYLSYSIVDMIRVSFI